MNTDTLSPQGDTPSLLWLPRNEFNELFDREYIPQQRYLMKHYYCAVSLPEIRTRIAQPPEFTPLDESFPGPVERWYGQANTHLFLLTYHYGCPHLRTEVRTENSKEAFARISAALYGWKLLAPEEINHSHISG